MEKAPAHIASLEKDLRHISGLIKQKGREMLDQYPITPPQFIALQWLLEQGDMTIGELSNKMYLACSTTTDLVDRMEKNELVERVRDDKDRRVVRIHLLQKGEEIIHEVIGKRQAYLQHVLHHFSFEQVEKLNELLSLLHGEMLSFDTEERKEQQKK
ncbi:MarR family transcriptional regulator [Pontibacillus halophilus JSM 076056 = DSM 19796]|uniref:MarR family transcriptional regulator n=1 Tax=Pontibacillus halophilus JSM 076056 = DSM 19796 TaxID=1385510 RepID=A0A0A5GQK1_9BACI|nr:MarR family transcriptional regulator [Pontibacillus halophilus]KGX93445.1 MarR family transcriptional regulator [Pontibacillus halophilus JSM 076056 = DSM 19796]